MRDIIFTQPIFKEMIWGGNRLRSDFGYEIPSDHTGECWAIAAHNNGDCCVSSNQYNGMKLSELWSNHKELFGNLTYDRFPLLIKMIDAKDDLSIQVHPDDIYANIHENGSYGKTECWYILACDDDSEIIIGHNASSKEELKEMIGQGRWNDLIRKIPIKQGDFFQINPGTVHAIKGGTVILETQQNSDITYRLYDYERMSDGKKRELHIEKSIDVITCPYEDMKQEKRYIPLSYGEMEELITCDYYKVRKLTMSGAELFKQEDKFTLVSVVNGDGTIDGIKISKGQHFIIPYEYGDYQLEGDFTLSLVSC